MKIVALDFETANHSPLSACALGLAIFESGCGFCSTSEHGAQASCLCEQAGRLFPIKETPPKPQPLSFQLIESPYWLIKPPKGHGWFKEEWTEDIHGISWFDVRDQPEFGGIAPEAIPHLASADLVVAHNASFDLRVLHALLEHFEIPAPPFRHECTLHLARQTWPHLPNHQLSTLAAHLGIELNHHHAQSDAIAAGRVMLEMINPFERKHGE
ncbi:MAG TPA: exonuclease domain-containing protein [Prosthecobacter sp.]|nr:exonuclease domain-containing protein [Prosthecobacter sp.]